MRRFCLAQRGCWPFVCLIALWGASFFTKAMAAPVFADGQPNSAPVVPSPSLNCADDVVERTVRALKFSGGKDFWEGDYHSECRLDPAHDDRAIVALAYVSGEERTGKTLDTNPGTRDLDIVILELSDGSILARGHWDSEIQDDAEHLEGFGIDTGQYILAQGKRAFGIRTANSTHCTCANSSWGGLILFAQNGDRVDKLLETTMHTWQAESDGYEDNRPLCSESYTEQQSTIVVGRHKEHGMADLNQLTVGQAYYESDEATAKCPALPPSKVRKTWRFDGREYKSVEPQQGS
ncbi:PA3715 family protein [Dyella koreensis]|uniref:Secreted protein n=1 Tax=Dyella koreensis TaxID=311235 RepID=A0ABW8K4C1_9GAMM